MWVLLGLAAQGLFVVGLIGQFLATRKGGRILLPRWVIYLGLVSTLVLLIYASVRHDIVFVVGQLVNMVIGFRLLEIVGTVNEPVIHRDETPFPDVRPDTAQRRRM